MATTVTPFTQNAYSYALNASPKATPSGSVELDKSAVFSLIAPSNSYYLCIDNTFKKIHLPHLFHTFSELLKKESLEPLDTLSLTGSSVMNLLLSQPKMGGDIDFYGTMKRENPYLVKKAFLSALLQELKIPQMDEQQIEGFMHNIRCDSKIFGITIPTVKVRMGVKGESKFDPHYIDFHIEFPPSKEIATEEEASCISSADCARIDMTSLLRSEPAPFYATAINGYNLLAAVDDLKQKVFEVAEGDPIRTREGLRSYVRLLTKGLTPKKYTWESDYLQKWHKEYGFEDSKLSAYFKKLNDYLTRHYETSDIAGIAAFLCNLREVFASNGASQEHLAKIDRFCAQILLKTSSDSAVDIRLFQTLLFWARSQNFSTKRLDGMLANGNPATRFRFEVDAASSLAISGPWLESLALLGSNDAAIAVRLRGLEPLLKAFSLPENPSEIKALICKRALSLQRNDSPLASLLGSLSAKAFDRILVDLAESLARMSDSECKQLSGLFVEPLAKIFEQSIAQKTPRLRSLAFLAAALEVFKNHNPILEALSRIHLNQSPLDAEEAHLLAYLLTKLPPKNIDPKRILAMLPCPRLFHALLPHAVQFPDLLTNKTLIRSALEYARQKSAPLPELDAVVLANPNSPAATEIAIRMNRRHLIPRLGSGHLPQLRQTVEEGALSPEAAWEWAQPSDISFGLELAKICLEKKQAPIEAIERTLASMKLSLPELCQVKALKPLSEDFAKRLAAQIESFPTRELLRHRSSLSDDSEDIWIRRIQRDPALFEPIIEGMEKDFQPKAATAALRAARDNYPLFFSLWGTACAKNCLPPDCLALLAEIARRAKKDSKLGIAILRAILQRFECDEPFDPRILIAKIPFHPEMLDDLWKVLQRATNRPIQIHQKGKESQMEITKQLLQFDRSSFLRWALSCDSPHFEESLHFFSYLYPNHPPLNHCQKAAVPRVRAIFEDLRSNPEWMKPFIHILIPSKERLSEIFPDLQYDHIDPADLNALIESNLPFEEKIIELAPSAPIETLVKLALKRLERDPSLSPLSQKRFAQIALACAKSPAKFFAQGPMVALKIALKLDQAKELVQCVVQNSSLSLEPDLKICQEILDRKILSPEELWRWGSPPIQDFKLLLAFMKCCQQSDPLPEVQIHLAKILGKCDEKDLEEVSKPEYASEKLLAQIIGEIISRGKEGMQKAKKIFLREEKRLLEFPALAFSNIALHLYRHASCLPKHKEFQARLVELMHLKLKQQQSPLSPREIPLLQAFMQKMPGDLVSEFLPEVRNLIVNQLRLFELKKESPEHTEANYWQVGSLMFYPQWAGHFESDFGWLFEKPNFSDFNTEQYLEMLDSLANAAHKIPDPHWVIPAILVKQLFSEWIEKNPCTPKTASIWTTLVNILYDKRGLNATSRDYSMLLKDLYAFYLKLKNQKIPLQSESSIRFLQLLSTVAIGGVKAPELFCSELKEILENKEKSADWIKFWENSSPLKFTPLQLLPAFHLLVDGVKQSRVCPKDAMVTTIIFLRHYMDCMKQAMAGELTDFLQKNLQSLHLQAQISYSNSESLHTMVCDVHKKLLSLFDYFTQFKDTDVSLKPMRVFASAIAANSPDSTPFHRAITLAAVDYAWTLSSMNRLNFSNNFDATNFAKDLFDLQMIINPLTDMSLFCKLYGKLIDEFPALAGYMRQTLIARITQPPLLQLLQTPSDAAKTKQYAALSQIPLNLIYAPPFSYARSEEAIRFISAILSLGASITIEDLHYTLTEVIYQLTQLKETSPRFYPLALRASELAIGNLLHLQKWAFDASQNVAPNSTLPKHLANLMRMFTQKHLQILLGKCLQSKDDEVIKKAKELMLKLKH